MNNHLIRNIIMTFGSQKSSGSHSIYADKPNTFSTTSLIWLLLFTTLAALSWPFLVKTDEVVSVEGRLVTLSGVDIVASSQNGVIKKINVTEGDLVRKDSILFQLDSLDAQTRLQDLKQQLVSANQEYKQLKLSTAYSQQSHSRYQDELRAQLNADEQVLAAYRQTFLEGATSELSLVSQEAKVRAQQAEILRQEAEAAKLLSDNSSKLSAAQATLSQREADLKLQKSALDLLSIKAPVTGFIYDITPTGDYYPVSTGIPLARVTPLDDLKVEVCMPMQTTGDFHRYQDVSITVQSLNLLQSGTIPGYIDYISSDLVEPKDSKSQACFKAFIKLSAQGLRGADGNPIHLRPGLGVIASIKIRKATYFELFYDSMFKRNANS